MIKSILEKLPTKEFSVSIRNFEGEASDKFQSTFNENIKNNEEFVFFKTFLHFACNTGHFILKHLILFTFNYFIKFFLNLKRSKKVFLTIF